MSIGNEGIEKAKVLLAEAGGSDSSAHSAALATQAIGHLLLYFAEEQHDATSKLEKMIQEKLDARVSEFNAWLNLVTGHGYPGGK